MSNPADPYSWTWSLPAITSDEVRRANHYHPEVIERSVLRIPECSVLHGESVNLIIAPVNPFRPIRLMVDPNCAPFFDIEKVLIRNQVIIDGPIAATWHHGRSSKLEGVIL